MNSVSAKTAGRTFGLSTPNQGMERGIRECLSLRLRPLVPYFCYTFISNEVSPWFKVLYFDGDHLCYPLFSVHQGLHANAERVHCILQEEVAQPWPMLQSSQQLCQCPCGGVSVILLLLHIHFLYYGFRYPYARLPAHCFFPWFVEITCQ